MSDRREFRVAIDPGLVKTIAEPPRGTVMRRLVDRDGDIDNVVERLERKPNGDWAAPGHEYGSRGWAGIVTVSKVHGWTWVLG